MQLFVQKYKVGMDAVNFAPPEEAGGLIAKAKKIHEVYYALCTEGLLWHALTCGTL